MTFFTVSLWLFIRAKLQDTITKGHSSDLDYFSNQHIQYVHTTYCYYKQYVVCTYSSFVERSRRCNFQIRSRSCSLLFISRCILIAGSLTDNVVMSYNLKYSVRFDHAQQTFTRHVSTPIVLLHLVLLVNMSRPGE